MVCCTYSMSDALSNLLPTVCNCTLALEFYAQGALAMWLFSVLLASLAVLLCGARLQCSVCQGMCGDSSHTGQ